MVQDTSTTTKQNSWPVTWSSETNGMESESKRKPFWRRFAPTERRSRHGSSLRSRFTVMVVPHNGEKGLSFGLSIPLLAFILLLLVALVAATIYLAMTNHGVSEHTTGQAKLLERSQANLDEVSDEIANLLKVYGVMNSALQDSLRASSVAPGANNSTGRTVSMEDFSGNVQDLSGLSKALESAIAPMGELSQILRSQRQLLTDIPNVWPVGGGNGVSGITMEFGPNLHPIYKNWYLHKGIDIAGASGLPVVASAAGRVIQATYDGASGYGYFVTVEHKYGFKTKYAHLGRILVSEGQEVAQGERLGILGTTGISTGAHVHFEVILGSQVLDPVSFLKISNTFARWTGDRGGLYDTIQ